MRYLTAFSLILIAFFSAGCLADSLGESSSQSAIRKIIADRLVKLDRDAVVFHYEKGTSDFSPQNSRDVWDRIRSRPSRFFDSNILEINVEGPGLYVAIDPVASRLWGGENPNLFVLTVKSGALVLDTKISLNQMETKQIAQVVSVLKCDVDGDFDYQGGMESIILGFRNSKNQVCRKLMIDAIRQLNLQAILYSFPASRSLTGCRQSRFSAFNVIDSSIIDESKIAYYSDTNEIENEPLASHIVAAYTEAEQDYDLQGTLAVEKLFRPKTLVSMDSAEEYIDWKQKYVYACGPAWSPEQREGQETQP